MISGASAPGWSPAWEAARCAVDPEGVWTPVRITVEYRGAYHAIGEAGTAWVELTGRAYNDAGDKRALPAVGDFVLVERWTEAVGGAGAATVRAVLPRQSLLVRKAAGEATLPQPLAANVDVGIVMTSANADLSPARLERYIGLLRDGGIEPVIAVSKLDLVADPAAVLAAAASVTPRVVGISTISGAGIETVRALGGEGRTAVVLGSSGVGKSSLLNAMIGTAQETRGIKADMRGRHTTTRRELFVASDGSLWIDTPGMRELAQWIDDAAAAADAEAIFHDIAGLGAQCRFRDCRHQQEPGCAVRGAIAPERLARFRKLEGEREVASERQAAAAALRLRKRAKKVPPPTE